MRKSIYRVIVYNLAACVNYVTKQCVHCVPYATVAFGAYACNYMDRYFY